MRQVYYYYECITAVIHIFLYFVEFQVKTVCKYYCRLLQKSRTLLYIAKDVFGEKERDFQNRIIK